MANTLDCVWVKYKAVTDKTEKFNFHRLNGIKKVQITEFLATDPNELGEAEQKVQQALKQVYDLNEKQCLFQKFPAFRSRKNPLTIDLTDTNGDGDYIARYCSDDNVIIFKDAKKESTKGLVRFLAHELKHAEQYDKEVCELANMVGLDAYAGHQLHFLMEAQAYAFDARVYYEIFGKTGNPIADFYEKLLKEYTNKSGRKDFKKIEEKMICYLLDDLYKGRCGNYKHKYDELMPVGKDDEGLTRIPKAFHLSQSLLTKLAETPRKAFLFDGKLRQARKNKDRDEYIRILNEVPDATNMPKGSISDYKIALLAASSGIRFLIGSNLVAREDIEVILNYSQKKDYLKFVIKSIRKYREKECSSMFANALCERMKDSAKSFKSFISLIKNKNGNLPLTKEDFDDYLISDWVNGENFSTLLKLKGKDGMPLVDEYDFVTGFARWARCEKNASQIYRTFDSIKDKNGNFPFSRFFFDDVCYEEDGMLGNIKSDYVHSHNKKERQNVSIKLSIVAGWKDKDGLPIITDEELCGTLKAYRRMERIGICSDAEKEFTNVLERCLNAREEGKDPKVVAKSNNEQILMLRQMGSKTYQ